MYVDAGDSIPPTLTRCRVPAVQGFSGKYRSPGEDDFPENRLRPDLAQPMGTRTYLCRWEWNSRSSSYGSCSFSYALASPADMYFAFTVLRADEQAVDDGHRDVELLEDF